MKKQLLTALLSLAGFAAFSQAASWVSQATGFTPVSSGVRYVSAVDSNVVWIGSYDGSGGGANRQDFSRTVNGGTTWTAGTVNVGGVPIATDHDWSMICGVNADTAFAMFYNATVGSGGGIWSIQSATSFISAAVNNGPFSGIRGANSPRRIRTKTLSALFPATTAAGGSGCSRQPRGTTSSRGSKQPALSGIGSSTRQRNT